MIFRTGATWLTLDLCPGLRMVPCLCGHWLISGPHSLRHCYSNAEWLGAREVSHVRGSQDMHDMANMAPSHLRKWHFFFVCSVLLLKTGFLYVGLAVLELTL